MIEHASPGTDGFRKPDDEVVALSSMLQEWLRGVIIDPDTGIDSGGGFGCRDLWFWMGGKEIYMQIKTTGRAR
jgi:hypothetical protein